MTPSSHIAASSLLLDSVYTELDLISGNLLEVSDALPSDFGAQQWSELGDWLLLAARVKAERVFFLNDDPVLVFSSLPPESTEKDVLDYFRRTWSLARPRCLFLAVGGELRVYSLANPPTIPGATQESLTALEIVTKAADIGDQLARFHRERLESGATFEDPQMGEQSGRADQQLLRDVRVATDALTRAGLPAPVAHLLIERAVLVRYLEDRGILTEEYFDAVESNIRNGPHTHSRRQSRPDFGQLSRFIRMLENIELSYGLFEQLAKDFNGDLFVTNPRERDIVTAEHLTLLMELLQGKASADQEPLFLWAYDFSVIPTNLISNMYEMFYREEVSDGKSSTYYTPPELVELVLSDVLNEQSLDQEPTICDPACGSGIFLVEAYRRIVRHEMHRKGQHLSSSRLRELLLGRIAGCDIDEAAVRLAAFSLYVAFLNYQSPQDIRQAGPLPKLIQSVQGDTDAAPLVIGNAFWPRRGECWSDRHGDSKPHEELPWSTRGFDIVVGNPPWTQLRGKYTLAELWAKRQGRKYGDRSPSQLFLWRALDLLSEDGVAALLISAKAMLNVRTTSLDFRKEWLDRVRLEHIVNFSPVRKDFFRASIAPFMLVRFRRASSEDSSDMVIYETASSVPRGRRGSSALARLNRQIVSQASLQTRDYLWKTYSAGSLRDDALVARLETDERLSDLMPSGPLKTYGYGYQRAKDSNEGDPPSRALRELRSLTNFKSWGPLREEWFEPVPPYVKFVPNSSLFRGQRLLVRRGVSAGFGPHARLETRPFAFRHTTFGVSLDHLDSWQAKIILGTLLSSLGRYWLYMVSGSWGTWNDEIRSKDLLNLPLRLASVPDPVKQRIVGAIDELHYTDIQHSSVQDEIDEGVADLFELTDSERNLIADFWSTQWSNAVLQLSEKGETEGTEADLDPNSQQGIEPYLRVLLRAWNRRLGDKGEFAWRVWQDPKSRVVAVVLETRELGANSPPRPASEDGGSWLEALRRLGVQWDAPQGKSILRYGMVRAVTDTAIAVVKRDEQRLWTATAARQDADATAAQLMSITRK